MTLRAYSMPSAIPARLAMSSWESLSRGLNSRRKASRRWADRMVAPVQAAAFFAFHVSRAACCCFLLSCLRCSSQMKPQRGPPERFLQPRTRQDISSLRPFSLVDRRAFASDAPRLPAPAGARASTVPTLWATTSAKWSARTSNGCVLDLDLGIGRLYGPPNRRQLPCSTCREEATAARYMFVERRCRRGRQSLVAGKAILQ